MPDLIISPWGGRFESLVKRANSSLVLCSPYVSGGPCAQMRNLASGWREGFQLLLLTDLSRDNMLSGSTDVSAILSVVHAFPGTEIRFLPSLHAKVYVADAAEAVVTSANMTAGGLFRNFEYGVHFTDGPTVEKIRDDVVHYASLGSPIQEDQLRSFASITSELREMRKSAERSLRSRLRREFDERMRQTEEEILRARVAGRTPSAIFTEAIRHILRGGPRTTVELHGAIQGIHPDLCDDAIDRIIDGVHYGKKWKHAVRSAQQRLKASGEIELVDGRWWLRGNQ